MSEVSTEENGRIVSRVSEAAMNELHAGRPISAAQRLIHDIEHMMQEVNSGASFEQYFRWASLNEVSKICDHLRTAGLQDVSNLVSQAIEIAFPNGLPSTDEEKSEATDWTPAQEEALAELFPRLEEENGRVTNTLGAYAKRSGV
ncbi:MAG: DMP19 family protein [Pyrinomonadaceae bacterium]